MADEEATASKRQIYIRCNGRALKTTSSEVIEFFSACGKPTSILNKYGEPPGPDGIYHGPARLRLTWVSGRGDLGWRSGGVDWRLPDDFCEVASW